MHAVPSKIILLIVDVPSDNHMKWLNDPILHNLCAVIEPLAHYSVSVIDSMMSNMNAYIKTQNSISISACQTKLHLLLLFFTIYNLQLELSIMIGLQKKPMRCLTIVNDTIFNEADHK